MYIKILKKKYQEKWENAYLRVKNARAPRALRRALDPGQYWLASFARLRFATSARSGENFWPPRPNPGSATVIFLLKEKILCCPIFLGYVMCNMISGRVLNKRYCSDKVYWLGAASRDCYPAKELNFFRKSPDTAIWIVFPWTVFFLSL